MTLRGVAEEALRSELHLQAEGEKRELAKAAKCRHGDMAAIIEWAVAYEAARLFEDQNTEIQGASDQKERDAQILSPRVRLKESFVEKAWEAYWENPRGLILEYWNALKKRPGDTWSSREGHDRLPALVLRFKE